MSAVHVVGHVVKRGVAAAQHHFSGAPSAEYVAQLQQDAELFEKSAFKSVELAEFLPVIITGIITLLIIASIRYTVGDVMASLSMIESPSSTAIIEPKQQAPPPYSDAPDAPLEKEPLMAAEPDVEITLINHVPITSKITTTMGQLQRTGGFFSRWRGLGLSIFYHSLHSFATNAFSACFGALFGRSAFGSAVPYLSVVGTSVVYVFISVALVRWHTLWTHSMVAKSAKPWYRRMVNSQQCKVLILPTFVHAMAQQATFLLPLGVTIVLNVHGLHNEMRPIDDDANKDCMRMMLMGLRFLAVPATALFVGLAVLMPAAVTLTRIEATLLAEDEQTIVPFDRQSVMGDIDVSARGGNRALFVQAWRSFDRAARLRLIKLYAKMILAQFTVAIVGLHLAVAELYFVGPERLAIFFKSAVAQLKLMAIEAHRNGADAVDVQIN